jgi:hypothetical protein
MVYDKGKERYKKKGTTKGRKKTQKKIPKGRRG